MRKGPFFDFLEGERDAGIQEDPLFYGALYQGKGRLPFFVRGGKKLNEKGAVISTTVKGSLKIHWETKKRKGGTKTTEKRRKGRSPSIGARGDEINLKENNYVPPKGAYGKRGKSLYCAERLFLV